MVFKYFIHQIVFVFVVLNPLNPLKDMTQVDEINYKADFDNLYSRMDDFDKFFNAGKISYNMLKYIPGLAKNRLSGAVAFDKNKKKICR